MKIIVIQNKKTLDLEKLCFLKSGKLVVYTRFGKRIYMPDMPGIPSAEYVIQDVSRPKSAHRLISTHEQSH